MSHPLPQLIPFDSLPDANKRVLIAADVLEHVKFKRIRAQHRTWLKLDGHTFDDFPEDMELRDVFAQMEAACETCQIGAMAYAAIMRFNSMKVSDINASNAATSSVDFTDIQPLILRFFDPYQLALIEFVFESGNGWTHRNEIRDEDAKRAFAFVTNLRGQKPEEPEVHTLLVAICENIIANHGEFKP